MVGFFCYTDAMETVPVKRSVVTYFYLEIFLLLISVSFLGAVLVLLLAKIGILHILIYALFLAFALALFVHRFYNKKQLLTLPADNNYYHWHYHHVLRALVVGVFGLSLGVIVSIVRLNIASTQVGPAAVVFLVLIAAVGLMALTSLVMLIYGLILSLSGRPNSTLVPKPELWDWNKGEQ